MLGLFAGRQHNKIRELLSAYIDGEVSEAEASRVDEHLEHCDECRVEFDTLSSTVNLLGTLPQVELTRSFVLTEEPAPARPAFSFVWPTRVAAGMAAALLIALMVGDFAGFLTQSTSIERAMEAPVEQSFAAPAAPAPAPAPAAPAAPPEAARALPVAPAPPAPAPPAPALAAPAPAAAAAPAPSAPALAASAPAAAAAPAPTPAPSASALAAPASAAVAPSVAVGTPTPESAASSVTADAAVSELAGSPGNPGNPLSVTQEPSPRELASGGAINVLPGAEPSVSSAVSTQDFEDKTKVPAEAATPATGPAFNRTPASALERPTGATSQDEAVATIRRAVDDDDGTDFPFRELEIAAAVVLVALLGAVAWVTRRRRFSP